MNCLISTKHSGITAVMLQLQKQETTNRPPFWVSILLPVLGRRMNREEK